MVLVVCLDLLLHLLLAPLHDLRELTLEHLGLGLSLLLLLLVLLSVEPSTLAGSLVGNQVVYKLLKVLDALEAELVDVELNQGFVLLVVVAGLHFSF